MNDPRSSDLGAVKFSRAHKGAGVLIAALAAAPGFLAYSCFADGGALNYAYALGLLLLAAGVAWGGCFIYSVKQDVFEHGVRKRTILGERVLRWSEVIGVGYNAMVVEGQEQNYLSLHGEGGRPIVFSVPRKDAQLNALREALFSRISAELERELATRGRASWVKGLSITRRGIVLEQTESELAFADANVTLRNGTMLLSRVGEKRPLHTSKASEKNFYPGLQLIERLRR